MSFSCQDIDKNNTDINRHKVLIQTGEKMIKKLTKAIEESRKEKERLSEEKEKVIGTFKELEQKAFTVQENYEKTKKVLLFSSSCHHSHTMGKLSLL